ncbi:phosphate ABC transporter permease PstA [Roseofilum capinflatum]|uniref:Phosphate transport system permease protein PstA n=1 Tax=Roseofilum capinflatum BLCC-M114 TaxID=3022440 RepID=A0ABT7BA24_9CYAN|nr:phosphate ABC transporter permease PstA [Roseofilum capinflatum]MDJ1176006.1 phosphate ABC transporter permease PstA [Roseofilum capinflatum BLCC-M114]
MSLSTESQSLAKTLIRDNRRPRAIFDIAMTAISGICIGLTVLPLFAVLTYVMIKGGSRLSLDLFTKLPPAAGQTGGGIANAILGTFITVGIASVIAVPIGVLAAVYLSEFSSSSQKARQVARWIRFATNVLSGVPSIIAGVFAYSLVVLTTGTFSAFAGGVALSVLMLPTIIRTTDEALQIVPQDIRWASVGVGASNYQTVLKIVLPAALPAILTGVTLAVARASGETAPLLFTALSSNFWPRGLMSPTPSLAVLVYNFSTSFDLKLQELAWAASLVLVFLVLISSIIARLATRQSQF